MILLDDVVEILHLPNNDRSSAAGIDLINRRLVGAALVDGDLLGYIVGLHDFFKEPQGCGLVALGGQKKVDRLALLVYSAIKVFPDPFDLDVGFGLCRVNRAKESLGTRACRSPYAGRISPANA